ncbi:MAG: type 2 isopentenyl-diphosphate Delta-isomerase [Thermoproteota archaeon]|nr:MAG: type 2 isopentenyl-diphosphate Delta-isomerase [Candidatus Korarchaeota archaeon]
MGVGSQRAALEDPDLSWTFRVARDEAPDLVLIANIGATHIVGGEGVDRAKRVVDMIEADGLAVHLNPLQEAVQPGGTPSFSDVLPALRDVVSEVGVPVIVKETGAGISAETARLLEMAGVSYIDVAGLGGTNWAIVEGMRESCGEIMVRLSRSLSSWGIPVAASIVEVSRALENASVIASGGVRSGVDAAKAIALGADLAGAARPFLRALLERGVEGLVSEVDFFLEGLKRSIMLTGCRTPRELKLRGRFVPLGYLSHWLSWRARRINFFNPSTSEAGG